MQARVFIPGYNELIARDGEHAFVGMDIGVYRFAAGETKTFSDDRCETAFLLLDGDITLAWNGDLRAAARHSVFDEMPTALHVPCGIPVTVKAQTAAEVLIQKTENDREFAPVYYAPQDIRDVVLGGDDLQGCARRLLRDIVNYDNAPYANIVLGEDIHYPGRWSSYPPHHHDQPEVYYYRFDRPQGFGISIVGDTPQLLADNSVCAIPGGFDHPQVSAPGYAMYYVWMIRHLPGNPWTDRVDNPDHAWLRDPDAKLWQGPAHSKEID